MNHFNIAVDGPAGAGKSTIAKLVAKELGFVYVDTGAMYRAMALYFLRKGVDPKAAEEIERSCPEVDVTIRYQDGVQQVLLNGEDVSGLIRTEEVGNMASAVSGYMPVRKTGRASETAGSKGKCDHGRKGYWYLCSSRCTCKDLSYSFCRGKSSSPL